MTDYQSNSIIKRMIWSLVRHDSTRLCRQKAVICAQMYFLKHLISVDMLLKTHKYTANAVPSSNVCWWCSACQTALINFPRCPDIDDEVLFTGSAHPIAHTLRRVMERYCPLKNKNSLTFNIPVGVVSLTHYY